MRLLLLGTEGKVTSGRVINPAYRGTDRFSAVYASTASLQHPEEISAIWKRYYDPDVLWNSDDPEFLYDKERYNWYPPVVRDIEAARAMVSAYTEYEGIELEIIEVTRNEEPPTIGTEFLGYDVSYAYDTSLILETLAPLPDPPHHLIHTEVAEHLLTVRPLWVLMKKYVESHLNQNGLFITFEAAILCLECDMALYSLVPDIYDGAPRWDVLGLYKVPIDGAKEATY